MATHFPRALRFVALAAATAVIAPTGVTASDPPGFRTSRPPMLAPNAAGVTVEALITTGDTLAGGYRFEAIPDGVALRTRGNGRVDVWVTHETSTVPFPFNAPWGSAQGEANQNDFDNTRISALAFDRRSGHILSGSYAIDSDENFHRFCTTYLATAAEGFSRPILFGNEEAHDWVFRSGTSWPGPNYIVPGTPGAEQTGVAVAYDVQRNKAVPIYGMGRLNHENTVAVPGYEDLVTFTTDDTFFTTQLTAPYKPAWSQLYSYIAPNTDALMADEGEMWAFVSDDPTRDDYFDFAPGDTTSVSGHFIRVPKRIATGKGSDGADLLSADVGFLQPPPVAGAPPDGPQWVLDQWGNAENNTSGENVFRFVRLEDLAYDRRPGMSNVLYLVDSGRGTSGVPGAGRSTNGRVWKMVLDPNDPTEVDSLSILIEGDDAPVRTLTEIRQPDNIESTANGLYITEDPGSSQQFPFGTPGAQNAAIWRYDLATAATTKVLLVDQSADEGATDVDGTSGVFAPGQHGAWEASGIVDASAAFGPGAFLVTVQAHSLWIEKADGPDALNVGNGKDFTYKREGGQLVLVRIPNA